MFLASIKYGRDYKGVAVSAINLITADPYYTFSSTSLNITGFI